mmetsp:Transcript_48211/g.94189  ORF Transcript_48211/g.94189 Transcript_48211/m.94189 type:complete len:354 (+) Transcript_48211:364-1425(+)
MERGNKGRNCPQRQHRPVRPQHVRLSEIDGGRFSFDVVPAHRPAEQYHVEESRQDETDDADAHAPREPEHQRKVWHGRSTGDAPGQEQETHRKGLRVGGGGVVTAVGSVSRQPYLNEFPRGDNHQGHARRKHRRHGETHGGACSPCRKHVQYISLDPPDCRSVYDPTENSHHDVQNPRASESYSGRPFEERRPLHALSEHVRHRNKPERERRNSIENAHVPERPGEGVAPPQFTYIRRSVGLDSLPQYHPEAHADGKDSAGRNARKPRHILQRQHRRHHHKYYGSVPHARPPGGETGPPQQVRGCHDPGDSAAHQERKREKVDRGVPVTSRGGVRDPPERGAPRRCGPVRRST